MVILEATGTTHSIVQVHLPAGHMLEARLLISQMLQLLRLAGHQHAPLRFSGFMPPTGSFQEAILVAADGERTLTFCLESDAALGSTVESVHTMPCRCTLACLSCYLNH